MVALTGITLASNLGTFVLYALICGLTIVAFAGEKGFSLFKHGIIPVLGVFGNVVMVLTMVSTTPLLGVPAAGTHALVQVGGLKFHWVPHSTVLFEEQIKEKAQPPAGAMTVKFTTHEAEFEAQSKTVTVIG